MNIYKKYVILLLFFLGLIIFISINAFAGDVYVDNDNDPSWYNAYHVATIQEGVDNASDGWTIYVYDGTYNEQVDINKSVDIIGNSSSNTTNYLDVGDYVFNITSDYVNFSGFKIFGQQEHRGIWIWSNYTNISHCSFNRSDGGIIYRSNTTASTSWYIDSVIYNCTFNNTNGLYDAGIYLNSIYNLTVDNCTFICDSGDFGIAMQVIRAEQNFTMKNCNFTEVSGGVGGTASCILLSSGWMNGTEIYNNYFSSYTSDLGCFINVYKWNGVNDIYFHNNTCNKGRAIVYFEKSNGDGIFENIIIENNTFIDFKANAVYMYSAQFSNVTIKDNNMSTISTYFDLMPIVLSHNSISTNLSIENNCIIGNNDGYTGVYLNTHNSTCKNNNISGFDRGFEIRQGTHNLSYNTIYNCGYGMDINNPSGLINYLNITDSHIYNCTLDGIKMYDNIENSTLDNLIINNTNQGIYLTDYINNITISNCSIHNCTLDGIFMENDNLYIDIRDCNIDDNQDGVEMRETDYITLDNNTFFNNTYSAILFSNSIGSDDVETAIVSNNTLNGNNIGDNGLWAYQQVYNLTVENNNFSDFTHGGIYGQSSDYSNNNFTIYNNSFWNVGRHGIRVIDSREVSIINNTIDRSTPTSTYHGIYIEALSGSSDYVKNYDIRNNSISKHKYAIYLYGINFNYIDDYISNSTIENNNISTNDYGVYCSYVDNITIGSNIITNQNYAGIYFYNHIYFSTVKNNNISSNKYGFEGYWYVENITISNNSFYNNDRYAIWFQDSNNGTIYNNTFHNNGNVPFRTYSAIYIKAFDWGIGAFGGPVEDYDIYNNSFDYDGSMINLIGGSSNNKIVRNIDVYNNTATYIEGDGISLYRAVSCDIYNNSLTNNATLALTWGLPLDIGTNNNTIRNNTFQDFEVGVYLREENVVWNTIYNNYFDNTHDYDNLYSGQYNIWNITKTLGTNIIGGSYLGGNYWSNYTGIDNDNDGLGDTLLPHYGDYHPLVYITPVLSNASVEPNPGYETNTFWFNVSAEDADSPVMNQVRCVITYEGNAFSNTSMNWIVGNNLTGANFSYNVILNIIGLYGYKFQAYDGNVWNETTEQYLWVQGLPGHFDAELFICFYDSQSGSGIDEKIFKIYLSNDTTINSDDRIYNSHKYTYTGAVFYYKITDYFDNKIYPLSEDYATVTINRLYKYLDIPITWYDLAVKNMNETIMHFSMNNGTRYYNVTLFPQDTYHLNVIPGVYNVSKTYYYVNNGSYQKNETDTLTVYNASFYIASGYTALVYISWYNTNEGLGLPLETLQIYIDGVRQYGNVVWTYINKTFNLTVKDYYNLTMYYGDFTVNNTYTFLDLGLTFHSYLFGNKNDDYYMISLLKDGGTRWYERGIVPYGEREFLLPTGNYTLRIYDKDWNDIYNSSSPIFVNRSRVYVIHGTNLSLVINGQSVIIGQLLELQSDFDDATRPDIVRIVYNPPSVYSVFDTQGAVFGTKLVCPAIITIATTRNQSTINSATTFYPLILGNTSSNGTITVKRDTMYFAGDSTVTWVNVSYGSTFTNYSYIPNNIKFFGQNITVDTDGNLTIIRETQYQQLKKFSWTKYTDTLYYTATVDAFNPFSNANITEVYIIIEYANDTTPNFVTTRLYDVTNGVYLTRGENFFTTASGIHFYLDSIASNTTRSFTGSYYGTASSQMSSDAIVIIDDYQIKQHTNTEIADGTNWYYVLAQWINLENEGFIGSIGIQFNFDTAPYIISSRSFDIYDRENGVYLDRDNFIWNGQSLTISQETIGTVQPNSARTFEIYFLFISEDEEDDIVEQAENWLKQEAFLGLPWFAIIEIFLGILALAVASSAYDKRRKFNWDAYKRQAWMSFIIALLMFILFFWYQGL